MIVHEQLYGPKTTARKFNQNKHHLMVPGYENESVWAEIGDRKI